MPSRSAAAKPTLSPASVKMLNLLYRTVYLGVSDASTYVFLCGKKEAAQRSLRKRIHARLRGVPRIDVVYPEWIFNSYLESPEFDLLRLERHLANSVDFIVVPLECPGAFAELGAFASLGKLHKKTIVLEDDRFVSDESFINAGPIRAIKRARKGNVIPYDRKHAQHAVDRVASRIVNVRQKEHTRSLTNLFGLSRFLFMLVAVRQPVAATELTRLLDGWSRPARADMVPARLAALTRKGLVAKDTVTRPGEVLYGLSPTGSDVLHQRVLGGTAMTKRFFAVQARYIRATRKTARRFDASKEWERLLEV